MTRNLNRRVNWIILLALSIGCSEQKVPGSTSASTSKANALPAAKPVAKEDPNSAAMARALDDEYKARATYRATIAALGEVRPFINIVEAEQRHIDRLLSLYADLGLQPAEDQWTGKVTAPKNLQAACAAGVKAEIDNVALYDNLLAQVTSPIVRPVLVQLQSASRQRHLPAFERCVARTGGT